MKKTLLGVALLSLPLWAWAKLPVVASFSIVADMTREIGGDRVEVVSLVGPNQDAHVFQPAPADVKRLAAAKVFVVNGLGFEGWMGRLTRSAGFKGTLIEASKGIQPLMVEEHGVEEHGHQRGGVDPHAWQDPERVRTYIKNIAEGLSKADPEGQAVYRQRAADYGRRVSEMDQWAAKAFAAVPAVQRKVLTSHDAFAYLGKRYGIQLLSPQGVSTDTEASAKAVAMLVRQVKKEKVKAIFFENMSDKRLLEQLAREANVKAGAALYADALSAPNGPANSYLALFRYNVDTILKSFR
ncbi:metal ABC transporter substrate-binding protein [Pseudogulbenkiania ferrooxidans]|uniref:Periplasmic solute binding protein n=1 Tax=Pseudogulbenkiania ferrooxidans 2002 TaxID=279714 RepID=B9Z3F0_9NEIS|nr:metal ABC transporter substrate-binding protein [Pseudogulbenkiania ferrooxidans]EEG08377.1 periplasmic solute binding protein [Pseudogulbenkiania ferrooxidans 2002]